MTRKERNGKRKSRRINSRIPSLGYYLIVIDTNATERNYFIGLRNALPEGMRNKLIIHVEKAKKTDQLIKKCVELFSNDPQYRIPWIVFDRDQVTRFDNIIVDAKKEEYMLGGLILALKFGCMVILGKFLKWLIHKNVVGSLVKNTSRKQDKNILKLIKKYMSY